MNRFKLVLLFIFLYFLFGFAIDGKTQSDIDYEFHVGYENVVQSIKRYKGVSYADLPNEMEVSEYSIDENFARFKLAKKMFFLTIGKQTYERYFVYYLSSDLFTPCKS